MSPSRGRVTKVAGTGKTRSLKDMMVLMMETALKWKVSKVDRTLY